MRLIVTGHREEKLQTYDIDWVVLTLHSVVYTLKTDKGISLAYSGMASGVDLWFCEACVVYDIPFIACIPFEEQSNYMVPETKLLRESMLSYAKEKKLVKNSWMIDNCDYAIVVWDGNKGGTHNVLQQLIEKQIDFTWINPVSKKIWNCV